MKYKILILLLILPIASLATSNDQKEPATIAHIANIVSNFGNVLANPNDGKTVATSICGMIASILGMAADTRKITHLDTQEKILAVLEKGDKENIKKLQKILNNLCEIQVNCLEKFIK